jgi:signal transduction histidine kinase
MLTDDLYFHTTIIMDSANALLNEIDGELTEKQRQIVRTIIANAEKFVLLCMEFQAIPLEEVSSEMRHDLGNHLTPIRGYSDLLAMGLIGTLNDAQQKYVAAICASTTIVRQMVEEIIRVAREHAARLAGEQVPA